MGETIALIYALTYLPLQFKARACVRVCMCDQILHVFVKILLMLLALEV